MSTGVMGSTVRRADTGAGGARLPLSWRSPGLWLVAVTLVGLTLRLPSFGDSLFGDEVGAYWIIAGHSLGRVLYYMGGHTPSPELNPPGWFVLAWLAVKLFGLSAQSLKLVSLLSGTASIPMTYLLGRWTVGVRAGLAAAAIVACSPFLIFYSTEARPYALLVFFCLGSTLALLRALRGGARRWWAVYAICACGAAYTHFTGVFVLGAQFIWALGACPGARRSLLVATAVAGIGFLPWLPELIRTEHSPGVKIYGVLEPFGWHAIRTDLGHWAIGHPFFTLAQVPGRLPALLIVAGAAVAGVSVLARLMAQRPHPPRDVVLVIMLAAAAPVGAALYSAARESVWSARNIISSWPAFAVLLGALLTYPKPPWRVVALALVLAGFGLGALTLAQTANQRPDFDSAAAFIDHSGYAGAPVVDLAAPSPGPPTDAEAALALQASGEHHPLLRLGAPPLAELLRVPAYTPLPSPSGMTIARQASAMATDGVLFLVAPTSASIAGLEALRRRHVEAGVGQLTELAEFLGALPARFRPVTQHTWPGFAAVSVYVYRG